MFINLHLPFFFFLCTGKRDLQSREDENPKMPKNNRIDIDEEDDINIEDNEIPEEETNLKNDKQATELQDSTVDHGLDESHKKSIISMFIYNNYNNYIYNRYNYI